MTNFYMKMITDIYLQRIKMYAIATSLNFPYDHLRVFLQWDIGINQKMSPCFVCTAVYCANCILSWQNARLHESTTSFNSTELIVNTFLLFLSCFLIPNVCAICVDLLCFAFSTELQQMLPYRCEYLSRSCFFLLLVLRCCRNTVVYFIL